MTGHSGQGVKVLNTAQAAKMLGFSVRTLEDWRLKKKGPIFLKQYNSTATEAYYLPKDLYEFKTMHGKTPAKQAKDSSKKRVKKLAKKAKRAMKKLVDPKTAYMKAASKATARKIEKKIVRSMKKGNSRARVSLKSKSKKSK